MKVRKVKTILWRRGYYPRPGRGSHSVWTHPDLPDEPIVLCGADGNDAQRYLVAQVFKKRKKATPPARQAC